MGSRSNGGSRITGKTVYLLGAGFSVGAGAPVLSNFIPCGLDLLKKAAGAENKLTELIHSVEETLHHYLAAAEFLPNRLVNLEDLFCLIDLRKQYASEERTLRDEFVLKQFVVEVLTRSWKNHADAWKILNENHGGRGATIDDPVTATAPPVVPQRSFFPVTHAQKTPPDTDRYYNVCAYEAFLSQVLYDNERKQSSQKIASDVIVTLNYDLILEQKLWKIAKNNVCYGRLKATNNSETYVCSTDGSDRSRRGRSLLIYKIHGSINWLADEQLKGDTSAAPYIEEFWDPSSSVVADDCINRIPIIPPTWRKTAATRTVFSRLLGDALKHMRLAERIVIVGYSLPNTDAYFRFLLAEALGTPVLPEIQLWDVVPSQELEERISDTLGERIKRVVSAKSENEKGFLELVSSRQIPESVY